MALLTVDGRRSEDSQQDIAPTSATFRRAQLRGPVAVVVVSSMVFVAKSVATYRGTNVFTLFDDAMISMRYGANLAHGHGLVWNVAGAHVEGYTNFLWTLWLAALHLTGASTTEIAVLVSASGLGLLLANLWLVREVVGRVAPDRPVAVRGALWLTATSYPLLYWSLRGMEVGLIATVTTTMVWLALRWRAQQRRQDLRWLAGVCVIGVLTRTDALIPALTVGAFAVAWSARRTRARVAARLGLVIGMTVAAHTAFRLLYYGDPLPNTYYLKLAGAPLADRVARGLESFGALACASLLAPLALAAIHVARRRRLDPPIALLLAMFAAPAVYSIYVGGDAWEWMQFANRYLATGLTLLFVVAGVGLADAVEGSSARTRGIAVGGIVLAVSGLGLASGEVIPTHSLQYSLSHTGDVPHRVVLVVLAVLLLLTAALRARRPPSTRSGAGWFLTAAVVLTSGQALITWIQTGGLHVADDNSMAVYGLELRQATAPDATIAVVWAGDGPYFDRRPAVALLGKSDRHIAKEPPRYGVGFYPGHTKWDYAWSIGRLRPDLVAGLVRPTPQDLTQIAGFGYDQLLPGVWARRDSVRVDRVRLVGLLRSTPEVTALIARDL